MPGTKIGNIGWRGVRLVLIASEQHLHDDTEHLVPPLLRSVLKKSNSARAPNERFCAFVSYRHLPADRAWALWIARGVETYRTPRRLIQERGLPLRAGHVFRDEDELSTSAALGPEIERALRQSDWLIVVCSPEAVKSLWIAAEIDSFRQSGRADRILPLLISGTPDESFPEGIRARSTVTPPDRTPGWHDPLAADVRPHPAESPRWVRRMARLRILAKILGCEFEDLRQREQERTQKRLMLGAVAACVGLSAMAGLTAWALHNGALADRRAVEVSERLAERRAFEAAGLWDQDPANALLLAEAALKVAPAQSAERQTYALMTAHLALGMPASITNLGTSLSAAGVSADFKSFAIAGSGGHPQVQFAAGTAVVPLEETDPFTLYDNFVFSPDGTRVAALGKSETGRRIRVWSVSAGKLLREVDIAQWGENPNARLVGFSIGGTNLILGAPTEASYATVRFNIETGRQDGPPLWVPAGSATAALDPRLAMGADVQSGADTSTVTLVDLDHRDEPLPGSRFILPGEVRRLLVSSEAGVVLAVTASADRPRMLHVLDLRTGKPRPGSPISWGERDIQPWAVDSGAKYALAFTGDRGNPAERWDLHTGTPATIALNEFDPNEIRVHPGQRPRPLWFSKDGHYLFAMQDSVDHRRKWIHAFDTSSLSLLGPPTVFTSEDQLFFQRDTGTQLFAVSFDGTATTYDLVEARLPRPGRLATSDALYKAVVVDDSHVMTVERTGSRGDYRKRLGLFSLDGQPAGASPGTFPLNAEFNVSPSGTRLVAWWQETSGTHRLAEWELPAGRELWQKALDAPVLAAQTQGDTLVVLTLRGNKVNISSYDSRGFSQWARSMPFDAAGRDEIQFSADASAFVVGTSGALEVMSAQSGRQIGPKLTFSDRQGIDYSLALALLSQSSRIGSPDPKVISGWLTQNLPVRLESSADGTSVVHAVSHRPLFSPNEQRFRQTPPLRGAPLVSPDGRWFVRAAENAPTSRASILRVYEVGTNWPITGALLHPHEVPPWPQRLDWRSASFDPVIAARFVKNNRALVTVTTWGVIRSWYIGADDESLAGQLASADIGAALAAHQLDGELGVRTLARSDHMALRAACAATLRALETSFQSITQVSGTCRLPVQQSATR